MYDLLSLPFYENKIDFEWKYNIIIIIYKTENNNNRLHLINIINIIEEWWRPWS